MEWISIKDKLPEDDATVLCWYDKKESALPLICYYDKIVDEFIPLFCEQECYVKVTHWMPLPKQPKGI